MIKILITGNGGREHAIAWKLAQDSRVGQIYIATGNGGSYELEKVTNINATSIAELRDFALNNDIDLTIVGAEALLVAGIVDEFKKFNLAIFGADARAAKLEGSKAYAKTFMQKYGVKTANYKSFDDFDCAIAHLATHSYPLVVKASGLAAGKGVIICHNEQQAQQAVSDIMRGKQFGAAGAEIVIEEYLTGFEASILSFCDGETILPMLAAKDHKTIGENNTGANTGGMGAVAPHPQISAAQLQLFEKDILQPTLRGIRAENLAFSGVIFFGLMINDDGVYLIEYNMRFGDPETQALLPLLQNDLLEPIEAAIAKKLATITLKWREEKAVCVVAASAGYPEAPRVGMAITHIEQARFFALVFIAGAKFNGGEYITNGGRVLNVVGVGENCAKARENAYKSMRQINFEGIYYRRDIGS